MKAIKRILVPTDFSAGAAAAAKCAVGLARKLKARVEVVTVVDTLPLGEAYGDASYRAERVDEVRSEARRRAEKFVKQHFAGLRKVPVHVRDGNTFLEILSTARRLKSDLIVMGTHGRTGLAHLVIGSVTEKVVRKSSVPVLTVRGTA